MSSSRQPSTSDAATDSSTLAVSKEICPFEIKPARADVWKAEAESRIDGSEAGELIADFAEAMSARINRSCYSAGSSSR